MPTNFDYTWWDTSYSVILLAVLVVCFAPLADYLLRSFWHSRHGAEKSAFSDYVQDVGLSPITRIRGEQMSELDQKERELLNNKTIGRRIVSAACVWQGKYTIVGVRHMDDWMVGLLLPLMEQGIITDSHDMGEGFVDNRGHFLTREEAWDVAVEANQILRRCGGDEGRLYSENLH